MRKPITHTTPIRTIKRHVWFIKHRALIGMAVSLAGMTALYSVTYAALLTETLASR